MARHSADSNFEGVAFDSVAQSPFRLIFNPRKVGGDGDRGALGWAASGNTLLLVGGNTGEVYLRSDARAQPGVQMGLSKNQPPPFGCRFKGNRKHLRHV